MVFYALTSARSRGRLANLSMEMANVNALKNMFVHYHKGSDNERWFVRPLVDTINTCTSFITLFLSNSMYELLSNKHAQLSSGTRGLKFGYTPTLCV